MALVAIPTTFLLVWPLASVTDVSVIVQFLVALVGLGIAIDYALLIVVRWREERQQPGVTNEDAVRKAMQHAGAAVVFSGTTVAISLLALLVLPVPFMRSIGIAGLMIALVSVAVAITLLPVVLATIGPRFDWPRNSRDASASRGWSAWARVVVRHRWAAAVASTAVLVALVAVASSIQLGNPRADSLAQDGPARLGLLKLEGSGIGTGPLSPFDALVRSGDARGVAAALGEVEGVRSAAAPVQWRRDGTAIVVAIPTADGNSPAGRDTLDRLRVATAALPAGVTIGGEAAQGADFLEAVYGSFPLMLVLISILTFILLARAFRSLLLPLKAVLLNLLSVAAAWGLIVLVFQHGVGSDEIWGIEATRAINVELPIVVFAFLFGISMDYQVFIISRMREAYDRTGSTETAVVEGIGRTGRLVTSAALILFLAFVAFAMQPGTEAKIFAAALGGGGPDRRHHHPRRPHPRRRGPARPLELVDAELGGPRPPRRACARRARGTAPTRASGGIAHEHGSWRQSQAAPLRNAVAVRPLLARAEGTQRPVHRLRGRDRAVAPMLLRVGQGPGSLKGVYRTPGSTCTSRERLFQESPAAKRPGANFRTRPLKEKPCKSGLFRRARDREVQHIARGNSLGNTGMIASPAAMANSTR